MNAIIETNRVRADYIAPDTFFDSFVEETYGKIADIDVQGTVVNVNYEGAEFKMARRYEADDVISVVADQTDIDKVTSFLSQIDAIPFGEWK